MVLLVVGGDPKGRGVVQSASYGARAFGVRAGMSSAEAARRCPGAVFVRTSFDDYRRASRAVRLLLEEFSAALVVMASLDEGYLDFSGTDRLHPVSLLPVAERLRDRVREVAGLDCSIGIGPNRMVAKLASDAAKPRGLMEVREGWEEGFVAGLPLRALPGRRAENCEPPRVAWLHRSLAGPGPAGRRAGEAPRARRQGPQAARPRPRGPGAPGSPGDEVGEPGNHLDKDTADPARLERILLRLSAHVASQLRGEGLAARTVTLKLRHGDFVTITRSQTLPAPTDLDADVVDAARARSRRRSRGRRRGRGVRLVGVAATNLVEAPSPDLFEPPERTRLRHLTSAVDRVRERFGFDAAKPGSM